MDDFSLDAVLIDLEERGLLKKRWNEEAQDYEYKITDKGSYVLDTQENEDE